MIRGGRRVDRRHHREVVRRVRPKRSTLGLTAVLVGCSLGIGFSGTTFAASPATRPPVVAMASTPDGNGYWLAARDGGVFTFGDARFEGSLPGLGIAVDDIVGIAATPDGDGYWLVGANGGVYAFGDAPFYGSAARLPLLAPVKSIAATPDGRGYWLSATNGGVFAYGDATYFGGGTDAREPATNPWVRIASTQDGRGYWLVQSVGFISTIGDAKTIGSVDAPPQGVPAVDAAIAPDGGDWWVVPNGGVFAVGGAPFYGSVPGLGLAVHDVVAITRTPDGGGYWVLGADGGVYAF